MHVARLVSLLSAAVLLAAPALATGRAKGVFLSGGLQVEIVDAYAEVGKADFGDDQVIVVRLAAEPLDHAAIDGALDRESAFKAQAQNSPSIKLQFDQKTGVWRGSSYYLASGNGCGYCSTPNVPGARLMVEGGALKGRLQVKTSDHSDGHGAGADITFDLPIAGAAKATALAAGGGEPGQALTACVNAVAKKDTAAFRKACGFSLDSLDRAEENAKFGDPRSKEALETFFEWGLMGHDVFRLSGFKVTGGRALATQAELLVEGKNTETNTSYKGRVFMKKTDAGWVYDKEDLEAVY
jgi:hypothetical protein